MPVRHQTFVHVALLTSAIALAAGCEPAVTKKPPAPAYLPNASPADIQAMKAAAPQPAVASKSARPRPPQARPVSGERFLQFDPGTKLPPFAVLQRSQPLPLGGARKKPMLLHLWASWCGPCVKELPELLAFGRKGLVDVVAVSVDDHWPLVVKYFSGKIPNEVAWDPKIVLEPGLGVRSLPTTFLVDTNGMLRLRWNGLQDWKTPAMAKSILEELARPNGGRDCA